MLNLEVSKKTRNEASNQMSIKHINKLSKFK